MRWPVLARCLQRFPPRRSGWIQHYSTVCAAEQPSRSPKNGIPSLSQSLKPVVDFVVYSVELSSVQGLATPLTLYSWFAVASCISTVTLPPFGELAAREQQLEGNLRGAHSQLITNCEQIAFLGGEEPEKTVLNEKLDTLLSHLRKSTNLNFTSECVRQVMMLLRIAPLFRTRLPAPEGTLYPSPCPCETRSAVPPEMRRRRNTRACAGLLWSRA